MPRRDRLATGIYADRYGISAIVTVGAKRAEHRFPHKTPLKQMQAWRHMRRVELQLDRPSREDRLIDLETQIAALRASLSACQEDVRMIQQFVFNKESV
jgi:hypothetical protein